VGRRGELLGQRGTGGSLPRVLGKALGEFLCKAIPHYLKLLIQMLFKCGVILNSLGIFH
jgi:hypothetical protein